MLFIRLPFHFSPKRFIFLMSLSNSVHHIRSLLESSKDTAFLLYLGKSLQYPCFRRKIENNYEPSKTSCRHSPGVFNLGNLIRMGVSA